MGIGGGGSGGVCFDAAWGVRRRGRRIDGGEVGCGAEERGNLSMAREAASNYQR